MFTKINQIWPVIVAVAGAVGGIAYFIIQILTMRKNKLEIEKLRRDTAARGMIYQPTNDEILKYGVSGRMRLVPSMAAVVCFCVLSTYLYTNYNSSSVSYSFAPLMYDSSVTFNPAAPQTTNKEQQLAAGIEELKNENKQLKSMQAAAVGKEKLLIANVEGLKNENNQLKNIQAVAVSKELQLIASIDGLKNENTQLKSFQTAAVSKEQQLIASIDGLKNENIKLKSFQAEAVNKEKLLNANIEGLKKENSKLKSMHDEIQAKVIKLEKAQKNKIE